MAKKKTPKQIENERKLLVFLSQHRPPKADEQTKK
jgi:hypothetical protein